MKILCMDSSHKYLTLVLIDNDMIVAKYENECHKKQSERLFPELISLLDSVKWTSDDIDKVVITKGPGSYTGIRIAMTIAKVLCTQKDIPLYTLNTLSLYCGLSNNALSIMDARSKRAYVGVYNNGIEEKSLIMNIDDLKEYSNNFTNLFGDLCLIDKEDNYDKIDFSNNFLQLIDKAELVDNIHVLVPLYLKEQEEYKV